MNPYKRAAVKTKDHLIIEHLPLVKKIAHKLAARLPSEIDVDDLIQTGVLGLIDAINRYEDTREASLKTFAEFRIRGAMLDELRSKDWIPRSVRENATKLEEAYRSLRVRGIDHPDDKNLAEELGISLKELSEFIDKSKSMPLLSIDESASSDDENSQTFAETIRDPENISQTEFLIEEENKEKLAEAIEKLGEREKLILSLYYQEDLNLKEIAEVMDLTESRISQLRTKAIAQLRSYIRNSA